MCYLCIAASTDIIIACYLIIQTFVPHTVIVWSLRSGRTWFGWVKWLLGAQTLAVYILRIFYMKIAPLLTPIALSGYFLEAGKGALAFCFRSFERFNYIYYV